MLTGTTINMINKSKPYIHVVEVQTYMLQRTC